MTDNMRLKVIQPTVKLITSDFYLPHFVILADVSNKNDKTFMKKFLSRSLIIAITVVIANLFLVDQSFGQAGPLRLTGSGGSVTEVNIGGIWYEVHSYTTTGASTFTPPSGASAVEYLVVAGGGGGGGLPANGNVAGNGGGGAGGLLTNVGGAGFAVSVQSYNISVGTGGIAGVSGTSGGNGGASSFATISTTGGGGGASSGAPNNNGANGGSGGGSRINGTGGTGIAGQGNNGANASGNNGGGGGGGANSAGSVGTGTTGGAGGTGASNSITGTAVTYAAGGSGGNYGTRAAGANGTTNRGNGGGGASGANGGNAFSGGTGGSGIVIVRYKAPTSAITTQAPSTVLSGTNFTQALVVRILDGNGSPVQGVLVTAAIESGTGGSLTNATATTDASGNATFTNLQIAGPSGNSYTVNFTVPGSSVKVISNAISLCTTPATSFTKNDVQCFNTSTGQIVITASGGTVPYTYSIDNGANYSSPVPTGTFNNLPIGTYKIRVKDASGCESRFVQ